MRDSGTCTQTEESEDDFGAHLWQTYMELRPKIVSTQRSQGQAVKALKKHGRCQ